MSRRLLACQVRTILVDQGLGSDNDARRAETALQRAARGERISHSTHFSWVEAFERRDLSPIDLLHRCLARDTRLAANQHGAAAALPRRGATVLGRCDAEFVTERRQQMRVIVAGRDLFAVEDEFAHEVAPSRMVAPGAIAPFCVVIRV